MPQVRARSVGRPSNECVLHRHKRTRVVAIAVSILILVPSSAGGRHPAPIPEHISIESMFAALRSSPSPPSSSLRLLLSLSFRRPMSTRSYSDAVDALNSLQSNTAVLEALRASGNNMSLRSIPEMLEYLHRIGYSVSSGFASGCMER